MKTLFTGTARGWMWLLVVPVLALLSACGGAGTNRTGPTADTGTVTVQLSWSPAAGQTAQSATRSPADLPAGVDRIRATVTVGTFTASQTGSAQQWSTPQTVSSPVGTGLLNIEALNTSGSVLFHTDPAVSVTVAANTNLLVVVLMVPTIPPANPLVSLQVEPPSPNIVVNTTQQFVARGTYADGSTPDVTAAVTWNSGAPAIATISASGKATGLTPGVASINATLGNVTSNTAALTVTAVPMVSVQVTPPTVSLSPGMTRQFKATGVFGDNTTLDVTPQAQWSSDNGTVATVNATGLVTAAAAGSADITANVGAFVSNAAVVTVTPTPLASITISPNGASMTPGTTQAFTATGNYTDGSTRDLTQSATWSSDAADVAIISGAGLVTGVAPGKANVSASLTTMASSSVVVTVLPTPLASITVTPPGATIAAGTTQRYAAMATYVDNSTLNVTASVSWGSSNTGVATIGASGVATGVVPGNVTIAATLGGVTSSPVSLTVTQATVTGISVTPQSASILRCARQQYTATATLSDASSQDLTSIASWISSATGVATVSSSGRATGVTAGSANITASYGGVTSNAAGLTVTAPGNSKESEERRHCDNDDDDDDGHGDGDHGDH